MLTGEKYQEIQALAGTFIDICEKYVQAHGTEKREHIHFSMSLNINELLAEMRETLVTGK